MAISIVLLPPDFNNVHNEWIDDLHFKQINNVTKWISISGFIRILIFAHINFIKFLSKILEVCTYKCAFHSATTFTQLHRWYEKVVVVVIVIFIKFLLNNLFPDFIVWVIRRSGVGLSSFLMANDVNDIKRLNNKLLSEFRDWIIDAELKWLFIVLKLLKRVKNVSL